METIKINTTEDGLFYIKNGIVTQVETPNTGYGKQVISWRKGEIVFKEVSSTEQLEVSK